MKKGSLRRLRSRAVSVGAALSMLAAFMLILSQLFPHAGRISLLSAALTLLDGSGEMIESVTHRPDDAPPESAPTLNADESSSEAGVSSGTPESGASGSSGSSRTADTTVVSSPPLALPAAVEIPEGNAGAIASVFYEKGGEKIGAAWITNSTGRTIDLSALIEAPLPARAADGPQVLIVHTHTTECYQYYDTGVYDVTHIARTTDNSLNVVRVGDEIARALEEKGIGVIHDTAQHDYPAYNGAYSRSGAVVEQMLAQYPSIRIVLDIHRDAITRSDGTKIKPTAEINGKNAAQVMIIAGCEFDNGVSHPNWEKNLSAALQLQQEMSERYPGLCRPLKFMNACYNQNLSPGSMLIEVGSDANTLAEAVYSGELIGRSLAELLAAG